MVNKLQPLSIALLLVSLLTFLSGCNRPMLNEADYREWLFSDDNRIVKSHEVNGIEISARYLPDDYRELRARQAQIPLRKGDSSSEKTLSFLLSFEWQEAGNLMMNNLADYEEYKLRLSNISFNLEHYLKLEVDGRTYQPLLTHYEHNAGLSKSQQVYLVFAIDSESEPDQLDLILDDPLFHTGIHRLKFDSQDFQELPMLKKASTTNKT